LANLMARKRKKSKDSPESVKSIFDDRRDASVRDKHIVVTERRQSRFDEDSVWYLKATIRVDVEPEDSTNDSEQERDH
jgi:hypothetical protein